MAINQALLLTLHFIFVEFLLGGTGFLGAMLVWNVDFITGIVVNAVAAGIALTAWLLTMFCDKEGKSWTGECVVKRGMAVLKAKILYFFASFVLHALLLIGYIILRVKFAGVTPISATENVDAFIGSVAIQLLMAIVGIVMFFFWLSDLRMLTKTQK
jgi:hypothetical protein